MKLLESIRLVQFFLFEKVDVRVSQIAGVFGPNGSGKSSLLDAVQIALFGGNGNLVSLNAQADERASTRSIRRYCLGQYGETEDGRVRDSATTYITLIWRDTETGAPLSMGVCLGAGIDRDSHEIFGRYLLPGVELVMGDHLEMVNAREQPREWATFRHQIMERARLGLGRTVNGPDDQEALFHDSERFINAWLLALRGSGGKPAAETFKRAFRFALRMRFDKSVDEIVRNQVLESRPTDIRKFKEVTESFRRLAELVQQVEKKIADADAVGQEFARATAESRKAATWTALVADVNLEQANADRDAASAVVAEATENLNTVVAQLTAAESDLEHAKGEAQRVKQLRERHAAHAQHGLAQSQIEERTTTAERVGKELERDLGYLARVVRTASTSPFVAQTQIELQQAVEPLVALTANVLANSREQFRGAVKPALAAVERAFQELFTSRSRIEQRCEEVRRDVRQMEENLRRLAEGRVALSSNVQQLLQELRDQGLTATPICDIVRVTEADWQPVVESFLGPHLEALLVSGEQEQQAFAIYRSLTGSRAVYGAKIVRESQHRQQRPADSGSVAELIEGTTPAAVAAVSYLRSQLGDMHRVESDSEALAGRRTLTRDGMLVRSGTIERLRPVRPEDFRLGARGSREHREAVQRSLQQRRNDLTRLQTSQQQAKQLSDNLQLVAAADEMLRRLAEIFDQVQAARADVATMRAALTAAADEEYIKLGEEERAWNEQVTALQRRGQELAETKGRAGEALKQGLEVERRKVEAAQAAQARSVDARAHAEFDSDFAAKQWDGLLERYGSDLGEMRSNCDIRVRNAERERTTRERAGYERLWQLENSYREHLPQEAREDWRKASVWVQDLLQRLRQTELENYKAQMQEAYETSRATFRNDVAMHLYESLERLNESMESLNEALRTCPTFSNGERYHFQRKARPQYQALLKFIKDIGNYGPAEDLLSDVGELPEQFRDLLEEKTAPGAAGVKSPLDDYREFFEFDIEILREDPITHDQKSMGVLSKRLGSGSGGEHRAPLYVIAGAALAAAYRLQQGNDDGVRLILLDEAFNKMDPNNIVATMRYLEDLGLQVFMASPGENLGILTAFLHRYYDILRDAERNVVHLQGHDVSAITRDLFREDLPDFNPALVQREVMALTSELVSGPAMTVAGGS
ncbi:MAG: SbcC/MukB-like Walker B domain-containing protein [Casimicrobiaceae bacterium]